MSTELEVRVVICRLHLLRHLFSGNPCNGFSCSNHHALSDLVTSHIENSSEEIWTDDVLCDVVVEVTSTSGDDGVLHMSMDDVRHDLRLRSGQCKDDRLGSHAFHVLDV